MEQDPARLVAAFPMVTGAAGLTQSVYGDVGNLELVVPDSVRGFWVFWFNADEMEHHHGAAVGCWSAGLFVDTGNPLTALRISQLRAGQRALEVSARSGDGIERWTWTAASGFTSSGQVRTRPARIASPIVEDGDELHMLVLDDQGVAHLIADAVRYPEAEWDSTRPFRADPVTLDLARSDTYGVVAALLVEEQVVLQTRSRGEWQPLAGPGGRWATLTVAALRKNLFVVGRVGRTWVRIATGVGARWLTDYITVGSGDIAVTASSLGGGTLEIVVGSGAVRTHYRWSIRDRRLMDPDPSPLQSEYWTAGPDER